MRKSSSTVYALNAFVAPGGSELREKETSRALCKYKISAFGTSSMRLNMGYVEGIRRLKSDLLEH